MPERKPLLMTSPTNAWALGALGLSIVVPVQSVTEIYQPVALEAISFVLAAIWQWVLLFAVITALVATFMMRRAAGDGTRMVAVLGIEGFATVIVSACYLLLWVALVLEYGFGQNPLTQAMVGGLGLAALWRVLQIAYEVWKYLRANKVGEVVHTEALAQPKDS